MQRISLREKRKFNFDFTKERNFSKEKSAWLSLIAYFWLEHWLPLGMKQTVEERERVMAVGVAVDYDSSVLEIKNPPEEDFAW